MWKEINMKESTVSSTTLKLHADTIFGMYQKPIMVSSKEWKALQRHIESFVACLVNCVVSTWNKCKDERESWKRCTC